MVHDYWMYVDDPAVCEEDAAGRSRRARVSTRHIRKTNGSLAHMPWWNFVDWVKQWPNGEPPADADGSSAAALDLQLLLAYQWAADLERAWATRRLPAKMGRLPQQLKATDSGDRLGCAARVVRGSAGASHLLAASEHVRRAGAHCAARAGALHHRENRRRCSLAQSLHLFPRLHERHASRSGPGRSISGDAGALARDADTKA